MNFKTCLIVDDSRIIRKVARRIVEGFCYEVDEAADGAEALSYCTGVMPDMILVDWNMPVMDGLTFLRRLRALPEGGRPKVLFCTIETRPERRRDPSIQADGGRRDRGMTPEDFDKLQGLLATRAGYRLTRDRMNLAEHRLGPIARREGYANVEALLANLWAHPVASLGWAVIESLLNPETWFRRDRAPFDVLEQELLPALAKARPGGRVSLWSAGCSTGQEAWSIAMAAKAAGAAAEIVATDLSQRAIDKARAGLYTGFEIQRGLNARAMLRWFEPDEENWRVRPELAEIVRFGRANLLDEPTDEMRFDVIFCRNVLTHMEPSRRARLLDGLERRLVDDGCLFLGLDERLEGETVAFRPVSGRQGLYVKTPAAVRRAA